MSDHIPHYHFEHLTDYAPDALQQIQAIYDVSFPVNERKPFHYITQGLANGQYTVFIMRKETGIIVAFALMRALPTSQAMYIEYLAVMPERRSRGIGSKMVRAIIDRLKPTNSALIWEVDPPENGNDDNTRRIVFYERLGASLIEQSKNYGMPNYWTGTGIISFRLMWLPLQHDHPQPTYTELVTLITDIYSIEYPNHETQRDEIIASLDKK